jgi:hypothetical protein
MDGKEFVLVLSDGTEVKLVDAWDITDDDFDCDKWDITDDDFDCDKLIEKVEQVLKEG